VSFDTAVVGPNAYYTFNAQAGESVGLALGGIVRTPAATGQVLYVNVFPPGSPSAIISWPCSVPHCAVSLRNLAASGTYRVSLVPMQTGTTVAGTLAISRAMTASLTAGTPYALSLTQPGQPAVLSFTRSTAGPLSLSIGSISSTPAGASYTAILYNSSNGSVTSASSPSSMTLTSTNLPAGSYTVWIYPATASTASMNVSF
jgi:hypothetical protein